MSVADEVLIGSTLFLGIVAIFGPAYADRFKDWLMRPKLLLEFRQSPPDCHLTDALLVMSPSQKSKEPAFYFRFRVTNKGKTQARKCEALIESVSTADSSGNYQRYPNYTPVPGLGLGLR